MENTRIMFFGTPEFAVRILETLVKDGYDVIASVSQPDRPVGRNGCGAVSGRGARNELLEKAVCRHGLCVRLSGL